DFPRTWFTRRSLTPIAPAIRLLGVGSRVRRDLRNTVAAVLVSPLLVLGAVAWVAGLAEGRRTVTSRAEMNEETEGNRAGRGHVMERVQTDAGRSLQRPPPPEQQAVEGCVQHDEEA